MERRFEKRNVLPDLSTMFLFRRVKTDSVIYQKNKLMEEPMKQKLEIKNINSSIVLSLIQIQNLDFSEYLLIEYPKILNFRLFILKKSKKNQ